MKPSELVADLPLGPGDPRESRLFFRLIVRYLADHVYTAELNSGARLCDVIAFRQWLEELMAAAPGTPVAKSGAPRKLRLDGSNNPAVNSRFHDDCPRCGHTHKTDKDCGEEIRPGEFCGCVYGATVPA